MEAGRQAYSRAGGKTPQEKAEGIFIKRELSHSSHFVWHVSIQGPTPKSILDILGQEADRALAASPVRKVEIRDGIERTVCITITITNNVAEDG